MLHGVGSNEADLFGLAPYLDARLLVASARAPVEMGYGAYGWFNIEFTPAGLVADVAQARATACTACHRQERLGALNWPMDRVMIDSYVNGGQMPFGFKLTIAERRELYKRLVREYFATDPAAPGTLKSWLLGKLS